MRDFQSDTLVASGAPADCYTRNNLRLVALARPGGYGPRLVSVGEPGTVYVHLTGGSTMSDTSTTDAGAFSSEFLKSEGELLAYVAQLRTMAEEQPETFEAMQERGARYVAGLRQEADRVEAFMTDLRAKMDRHEHPEAT
jgi:hypothetical protein